MTDLHWVKPPKMLQQLAHAAVPNGSLIAVQGIGYKKNNAPETVKVLRAYAPFVNALRSMTAMSKYADLDDTFPVHPMTGKTGCIRSEN